MKRLKILTGLLAIFAVCSLQAQVEGQMSDVKSGADEIASETTEKTYKILMGDEVITNSVKISTTRSQDVVLDEKDSGLVNQDREFPKKHIVKTVKLDNDRDDDYDELIKFRYESTAQTDFVLVTNEDNILVALDDGENLQILEKQSLIKKDDVNTSKESYVFTNKDGKEVAFFIDEYKSLDDTSGM